MLSVLSKDGLSCWDILYNHVLSSHWNRNKSQERKDMIQELKDVINRGADLVTRNDVGWTPLMILSLTCEYEAVKAIFELKNYLFPR